MRSNDEVFGLGGLGEIFLNLFGVWPKFGEDWADNEVWICLGLIFGELVKERDFLLRDNLLIEGE